MKKLIFTILTASAISFFMPATNAQMMGGFSNSSADWGKVVEHTLREEQEGKELWNKLKAKETACADLNDGQYRVLGEYFMGQMASDSHAAMNAMMIQTHGGDGEEQMHVTMGKRLSGCDASATFPSRGVGFMPMMNMMWGGMNFGFMPLGGFSWIFMIFWWALIIAGIVALIKWLTSQSRISHGYEKPVSPADKFPLEILKERYAKGEIDVKEFEDKKKDLT